MATSKAEDGTKRRILFSVDFGTTFSGLGWAQTIRPDIQTTIIQWPDYLSTSLEGKTCDKVPTELRYEGSACKWGFQIRPNDERFQWFKLDLDPFVPTEASELSKKYPDLKALPPGYQHQPTTLVTDFLESLRQHAERILVLKLGEEIIRSTPVEYIITVPAMWSEAAQAKTRQCAEKAGMNKYASVHIISEPEAAAIYALDSMDPTSLHVGDTYVLCDAGGGTVDLISYRVTAVRPVLRVEEAAPGTGSLCGSTFLNRIFRRHMESKYGGMLGWDSETMDEAMERFETVIKRTFSGDPNEEFAIPVPGLRDNPDKGIKRGRIRMGGDELETVVFRVVTDKVIELVKAQMEATGTRAKAVLLVGGYGQSAYLRDAISKAIAPIPVTQPPYGWTAVVRGALIKGLAEIAPSLTRINVESRTARKYYGIVVSVTYRKGVHDKSRKYWGPFYGEDRVDVMSWFITKGRKYKENESITTNWQQNSLVARGKLREVSSMIYVCRDINDDGTPMYEDDDRVQPLARLNGELWRYPRFECPVVDGADGEKYYRYNYEIRLAFGSAHVEYSCWRQGKRYGVVNAAYD